MAAPLADHEHPGGIEVISGPDDRARAGEARAFWRRTGDPTAVDTVRPVCVLRGENGRVAAATAVFAAEIPLLGGRRFWLYRALQPDHDAAAARALLAATYETLAEAFDPEESGPVGLCALLDERERAMHPRDARWERPPMLYAGYAADGRQVRVGYFPGARI